MFMEQSTLNTRQNVTTSWFFVNNQALIVENHLRVLRKQCDLLIIVRNIINSWCENHWLLIPDTLWYQNNPEFLTIDSNVVTGCYPRFPTRTRLDKW